MRKLLFCIIVLGMLTMGVSMANAAGSWTEDWNYGDRDTLSASSWPTWWLGWKPPGFDDWGRTYPGLAPGGGNYVAVDGAVRANGDAIYIRDSGVPNETRSGTHPTPTVGDGGNYAAAIAGSPVVRVEFSFMVGAVDDHIYWGMGDTHGGWGGMKQAFNIAAMGRKTNNGDPGEIWLHDGTGTANKASPVGLELEVWNDLRVDVEAAANGGDGLGNVWWRPNGTPTWLAIPEFTNIDMKLLSNTKGVSDPSTWTGMFMRMKRTGAAGTPGVPNVTSEPRIGAVTVSGVPEPATMVLLGLGGMAAFRRRNRKA